MGGCTSVTSDWTDMRDSQMSDVLNERQIQIVRHSIVRDTWEMIISSDVDSAVWLKNFNRHLQTDKELRGLFRKIESANDFQACSLITDDNSSREGVETPDSPAIDSDGCFGGEDSALKHHSHFVMETLGAAAECLELEDSTVFSNILVALGQIHATYRVKPHYLPLFWPTVRHSLRETLGCDTFTVEVESTWMVESWQQLVESTWQSVFAFVVGRMRDGIKAHQLLELDGSATSYANSDD